MAMSVTFNEQDEHLLIQLATLSNSSVSEAVRQAIIERLEDLKDLREAEAIVSQNNESFSHKEVGQLMGFV